MPQNRPGTRRTGQIDGSVRLDGLEADTLRSLVGATTPVPMEELAERLVDFASDASDAKSLQVWLHHVTLPKLASAEQLVYNAGERIVDPSET